ncbi:hypothetical protein [Bacillus sp. FJAT-26390]|uniref:hypothetical protein n=1 Tax=Bacillus sp. FJAT-26390 TaxID=1743142 RepID=UPI000807E747|nr:hypothetical protein [Bacillus sp. FJAT-26390]OBZ13317.1 hypothetical protein A7975_10695 [Bacillus sp. FJAT-26390]
MTQRRGWTDEENADLLKTVEYVINQGATYETAFELYAADFGRTAAAAKRQFKNIRPRREDGTTIKAVDIQPQPQAKQASIHSALGAVSDYINGLEAQNAALRETIDELRHENALLEKRVDEAAQSENELNHLLSIINRSRKEAFAGEEAPKKYQVIDGVPVFKN